MSATEVDLAQYIDQVEIDHTEFDYMEGPDVMEGGDSYAEGTPLHDLYGSKESRVFAALLSQQERQLSEQDLEDISGVPDAGDIAEELTEDPNILKQTSEGFQVNSSHPDALKLDKLENSLLAEWYKDKRES